MIKHEDLIDIYSEKGFKKNFNFLGHDNNEYIFDSSMFNYLVKEYAEEDLIDCISIVNGSIESMIKHKIAKKIEPILKDQ